MNNNEKQKKWNEAYNRGGNICFYPHEEVVRFINRHIRKRSGINKYINIMELSQVEWISFSSLDLGCGIGRHVKFMDEFGLNPYGIDLSDNAIKMGQEWFKYIEKDNLIKKLEVGNVTELPYNDNQFNICISCGVLDSMPRTVAEKAMNEVNRVLKPGGLMYLDLIMNSMKGNMDEVVETGYEKDTIQSYYTIDSIKELVGSWNTILEFKIITKQTEDGIETDKRAHIILKKNNI